VRGAWDGDGRGEAGRGSRCVVERKRRTGRTED